MPNIQKIMTDSVVTCTAQDNIYEAAVKMKQHDTGFIPIVDGERLIGVVTDRDLVIRAMAEKHPGSTSIRDVMTEEIISVGPEATIDETAELMADHQVRRLPVVQDGKLVGIVSLGDLAVHVHFADEAGEALSEISEQSPYTH
ncbi:CBS domain-containing protein [Paenibacillus thiaminolyticus]|uniref:CBS domain-containing protein n=1 Tax=Paenibacillus thiaminolyticus TaxID=49283 RepID=A0A3A3GPD3_PANTH|nr:CBS domain-containing protein [Paenibacillus thiaminolyticus]RJG26011.1 CBS domain-containing protein [Paenibacillus thiaminolyticus]